MDSRLAFALPEEEIRDWVDAILGGCEYVASYAHSHGNSRLWRLKSGGDYAWLKLPRQPSKMVGEIQALQQWAGPLGRSPRVIAYQLEPSALLLSEAPGKMATELDLYPEAERRLWREAGEYQAELHRIKGEWFGAPNLDGTPQGGKAATDPMAFVSGNIAVRLRQGDERGHWSSLERDFIEGRMKELCSAFEGEEPTAVHRDFGPRNWLTNSDGQLLSVIDWEHARWDVRVNDLARSWDDAFLGKPWLADEFFAGYGALDEQAKLQIQGVRLVQAVASIVWAAEVGDEQYGQMNRRALYRLMGEPD